MGLGGPLKLRLGIGGSAAAFFGFTGFAGIEFNPNDLSSLVIVLQGGGTAGLGGSINFGYIGTGEVHEGVEFSVRGAVNVGPLQARLPLWSSTGSLTPKYRFGFKEEDQLSLGMKASMDGLTTIKVKPTTAAAGVETGANVVGTTVWQKVAGWLVGWGFPTFGL
jgi:hypothetical protein